MKKTNFLLMKIECYNYMHSGENDHIANVMRVNQASIHQCHGIMKHMV